jgi:hypothetical protein
MKYEIAGEEFSEHNAKVYLLYLMQNNHDMPLCRVMDNGVLIEELPLDDVFNAYYD